MQIVLFYAKHIFPVSTDTKTPSVVRTFIDEYYSIIFITRHIYIYMNPCSTSLANYIFVVCFPVATFFCSLLCLLFLCTLSLLPIQFDGLLYVSYPFVFPILCVRLMPYSIYYYVYMSLAISDDRPSTFWLLYIIMMYVVQFSFHNLYRL